MNNEPFQPFAQPPQEPQPTGAPVPPQDNNFIVQPPTKKPGKAPLIIAIILGVLLLAAAGFIVYLLYFQPEKSASSTAQTNTQQSTASEDKAAGLIAKVRTAVSDQLKTSYKDMTLTDGMSAPMYTAPNTNYAVFGNDFGASLSVDPSPSTYDQTAVSAVVRVVTQTLDDQAELHSSTASWQKTYQNDAVICVVTTDGSPVFISCANTKDYSALITQIKPFADAYLASEQGKTYGKGVAFTTPKITKKTNGYSSASVGIGNTNSPVGGFAGLFYAKDSNWVFWKGTQNVIACGDYNTNDLQRAFEGDTCYDAKDPKAVVKVTL